MRLRDSVEIESMSDASTSLAVGCVKSEVDDLAILGGVPAFSEELFVGRPNVGDRSRLLERIGRILESRRFTNSGAFVQELESKIASWLGVRHCVLVCNATVGLGVVIRALGISGEVIVPSFTFVATAHALKWHGIRPVFCDIDESTHLIDPKQIEALVTPRTSAILGVHLWGRVCNIEHLDQIAKRHGVALFFDAAHAFGATLGGRHVGGFGQAEVFSFHATKFFNTFEGGAITTDDDDLAKRIRRMANFGFTAYDQVESLGTNAKMSEVAAAMGLTSFDALPEFLRINQRNHRLYCELLSSTPGISVLQYPEKERSNYQYVVIEYAQSDEGISRDSLMAVLWAENVRARRYFYPGCHRMEPYRTLEPDAGARLKHTETIAERVLVLPTGTAVTPSDIRTIATVIDTAVRGGKALVDRMKGCDA